MDFTTKLIAPLLAVTLTLLTPHAIADGAPTIRRELPAGRTVEVDGETLKAFTAIEYAEIVKLEDDYLWFFGNWPLQLRVAELLKREQEIATERGDVCRESLELVQADREILRGAWQDERKLRLEDRNSARAREWIPWALVVIESIGFGVLGVVSASK